MPREKMPDVIVLLPGITGSELKKNGKVVWGWSGKALASNLFTLGGKFRKDLALAEDSPTDDLDDGITAERVIPDLHVFPGLWKIDGYTRVSDYIRESFDVEEGQNFFSFPYDWRRDNRFSARVLQKKAGDWLRAWRRKSGRADARLILIGHSMGGLVSRYFLEVLEGWRETRALITFGTPYRGSLNAVNSLSNGEKKFGVFDLTGLARTLTALYQLLPDYECYDAGDGRLQRVAEASVPNLDPAMATDALRFHREIEEAVTRHRDDAQYRDQGYGIYPVVGVLQPTNQSARRSGDRVEIVQAREGEDQGGDGTVPRVSAIPVDYANPAAAMFAATKHGSLQNADAVLAHLHGVLTGLYIDVKKIRAARPAPGARVSLDNEDLYAHDEKVAVRARPQPAGVALGAIFQDVESGKQVLRAPLKKLAGGWQSVEFAPPRPGAYRVTVTAKDGGEPATDVFEVLPPPGAP